MKKDFNPTGFFRYTTNMAAVPSFFFYTNNKAVEKSCENDP